MTFSQSFRLKAGVSNMREKKGKPFNYDILTGKTNEPVKKTDKGQRDLGDF